MNKTPILNVLIDFDDTIYNYTESDEYACSKTFKFISNISNTSPENVKLIYKSVVALIKKSNNINNKHNKPLYFKKVCEKLDIHLKYVQEVINIYQENFYTNIKLMNGVYEFLSFLKKNGVEIGLLSNNQFYSQYKKLSNLGIAHFFDHITTTDEVGEEKPHPYTILHSVDKFSMKTNGVVMIGDNIDSDIYPFINHGILPFLFLNTTEPVKRREKYYAFGDFKILLSFFQDWFQSLSELKHLSGYFTQSPLCVQGTGGNISVKITDDSLVIKPSGIHMGDLKEHMCPLVSNGIKMFGILEPSMEVSFHQVIKRKYVVHIHFIPANIFLCSGKYFEGFSRKYSIVSYTHPGIHLANQIQSVIKEDDEVIFLENHGIIICADTIENVYNIFLYTCNYFHEKFHFPELLNTYNLYHRISNKLGDRFLFLVDNHFLHGVDKENLKNIVYCFPDLYVFFPTISYNEEKDDKLGELLITGSNIYIVAKSISKFYAMREVLESYCILYTKTDGVLKEINTLKFDTDPKEEYRRKIFS